MGFGVGMLIGLWVFSIDELVAIIVLGIRIFSSYTYWGHGISFLHVLKVENPIYLTFK